MTFVGNLVLFSTDKRIRKSVMKNLTKSQLGVSLFESQCIQRLKTCYQDKNNVCHELSTAWTSY